MPSNMKDRRYAHVVRFILDGEEIELRDVDPTRTVLQYLREDLRRTGTKEGCAEGDCGACTVVLAELDGSGRIKVEAVNACIQFLPTLDGKELFTVESLKGVDGALHPVQQALVDCHGSQCGFCTPGFAMSMFALYKSNREPSRTDIDNALAGNLCRCTGYRPIVDAAQRMYAEASSRNLKSDWRLAPKGQETKRQIHAKAVALEKIRREDELSTGNGTRTFYAPRSADRLAELEEQNPDATLLAGGTDVGLWVTKEHRALDTIIYTAHVPELQSIAVTDTHIEIGAAVTLTDAMPVLIDHYPALEELLLRYGSPPIRNAATLGGNIANGSPIGDSMPALLALNTSLVLRRGGKRRELPLCEFYLGYQETALAAGEFVETIRIPIAAEAVHFQSYKVSKRFDQDISAVCAAFFLAMDGDAIATARVAFGGMAATPSRAGRCEAALVGRLFDRATIDAAMAALDNDFQPISDARASADYRRRVCRNLLRRFYDECAGGPDSRLYAYGRA